MKVWVIGRNYPQPSNRMKGSFELEQAKNVSKTECGGLLSGCITSSDKKDKVKGNTEME